VLQRTVRTGHATGPPGHRHRGDVAHDVAGQLIEQEIRADLLDDEQAGALHAGPGSAALVVIRRHRNPDGRLIAVGIHTHPSDRFSIKMSLPLDAG